MRAKERKRRGGEGRGGLTGRVINAHCTLHIAHLAGQRDACADDGMSYTTALSRLEILQSNFA